MSVDLNAHLTYVVFDRRGQVPCMAADARSAAKAYIEAKPDRDREYFYIVENFSGVVRPETARP